MALSQLMLVTLIGIALIVLGGSIGYIGAYKVDDHKHPIIAHLLGLPACSAF